jgi:glycosyltransferase involved in cell wall biosynthesis
MNKKIIILITRGDSFGGAQSHVLLISKYFKNNQWDVIVVYGGDSLIFKNYLDQNLIENINIKTFSNKFNLFKDIKSLFYFRKLLYTYRPDYISLHSSKSGLMGRIAAIGLHSKVVFTVHGWPFTSGVANYKKWFYVFLEKCTSALINKYIVVSKFDFDLSLKYSICPLDKLNLIYNGIESLSISSKPKLSSNNKRFNIIMVARFEDQKNHKTLILAIKDLSNVNLTFIGDGPKLNDIKNYVIQNDIKSNIIFKGFSDKVDDHLLENDLFVLSSNWEGFPISTLEAMRCGLPVIVSDVGGAAECVKHGVNGFIFKNGDYIQLANYIKKLDKNRDMLLLFGKNSKIIFDDNYSSSIMFEKMNKIFIK